MALPCLEEVSVLGFGHPLYEALFSNPQRLSQVFNALRLFPSELCSYWVIEDLFPKSPFAPAL
jgi:hypothetical protein